MSERREKKDVKFIGAGKLQLSTIEKKVNEEEIIE